MEPDATEASLMRFCEAIDGYIELGMAAEASELLTLLHSEVVRLSEPASLASADRRAEEPAKISAC